MWSPWGNPHPPRGVAVSSPSPARLPPSSCHIRRSSPSLKDLLSLLADHDGDNHSTTSSRASSPPPLPVVHHMRSASSAVRSWCSPQDDPFGFRPGEEKRVVLYFTSLRAIRQSFQNCSAVRTILHGLRVAVDERDVSMHTEFLKELKGILGGRRQSIDLPQVFIGGRHVGGVEEVRELHDAGELKRYVEGIAQAPPKACEWCGDVRFVICVRCSGSRRCYSEKGGRFRKCTACNENGLVRCPGCCAFDDV